MDWNWYAGHYNREPCEVTHWTDMQVYPGDDEDGHHE